MAKKKPWISAKLNLEGKTVTFELGPYKDGGRLTFDDSENGKYELHIDADQVEAMKEFVSGIVGEVATGVGGVVKRFGHDTGKVKGDSTG